MGTTEATEKVECPCHWFITPVHFLPCGFSKLQSCGLISARTTSPILKENNLDARIGNVSTHLRHPDADPGSGHGSLRSRERARCGGHRRVLASWQFSFCRRWAKYFGAPVQCVYILLDKGQRGQGGRTRQARGDPGPQDDADCDVQRAHRERRFPGRSSSAGCVCGPRRSPPHLMAPSSR